ncbi:hypothetical protein J4Q44_G00289740 [Coregonus suidteri]|uniref:Uncharacterized protein n=1 Tax=Coregonus suidteri TaxID=861788 RepID=A0AAN8QJ73_9TELE
MKGFLGNDSLKILMMTSSPSSDINDDMFHSSGRERGDGNQRTPDSVLVPSDSLLPQDSQLVRGDREEGLCAFVNFKNANTDTRALERPRRMVPINGNEGFFWRTPGCLYGYFT